ncbi:MAG: glucans biosynthesis glucosyltransferase MdoH, partial [Pseudomonadota bacterium]
MRSERAETSDTAEMTTDGPVVPSGGVRLRLTLAQRRALFLLLTSTMVLALFAGMAWILSTGGFLVIEGLMLFAYTLTLPWLAIGFWNGVIGLWLDRRHGHQAPLLVNPALARVTGDEPIESRTAIVMPLRNEDPAEALARLRAVQRDLARTPWASAFEFHVLSDSDLGAVIAEEEEGIAAWKRIARPAQIFYHRRTENTGYKAGNIAEFLQRSGADYDFFLPLDADSVMGAQAILRLVRVMEAA